MFESRSSICATRSVRSPPAATLPNPASSSEIRFSSAAALSAAIRGMSAGVTAGIAPRVEAGICSMTSIFPRPFELTVSVAPSWRRSRTVRMKRFTAS